MRSSLARRQAAEVALVARGGRASDIFETFPMEKGLKLLWRGFLSRGAELCAGEFVILGFGCVVFGSRSVQK